MEEHCRTTVLKGDAHGHMQDMLPAYQVVSLKCADATVGPETKNIRPFRNFSFSNPCF